MRFKTIHHLIILILFSMLMACGTTQKSSQIETDDIVIFEEYGIDTDLHEKFKTAISLINDKQYQEAASLLEDVTSHTKKHSAPYINLAIAYTGLNQIEKAERTLKEAVLINPYHPVTNNELGLLYRKTGRFDLAKKTYETVVKRYPQFLPARKNLGILCDLFMNDLQCAISHYEAFLEINPNEKEVKIWLTDLKRRVSQ